MGSVEIYCRLRFRSWLYSVAVLNLNRSLVFSSSLSFMFFWWPKERKAPALAKSVTTAFCSRVASDVPRLAVVCHKQLFVQASGTKQLAFHAITATCIYTAQTNFVLFPLLDRLVAVILIVPVFFWYYHCAWLSSRSIQLKMVTPRVAGEPIYKPSSLWESAVFKKNHRSMIAYAI